MHWRSAFKMQMSYRMLLLPGLLLVIIKIYSVSCTDVCSTETCRSAANMLLESMDISVEPCEDFYKYACGNWKIKHPIQKDKTATKFITLPAENLNLALKGILEDNSINDSPSEKEAKLLYRSCMNEEALQDRGNTDIWNMLEGLGGMPLLGSSKGGGWTEANYSLEDLLVETRIPVFFEMSIKENMVNPSQYGLYLERGKYGLPDKSLYKNGINNKVMESYRRYLIKIAKLLGADEQYVTTEINNVVQLEMSLAKVMDSMLTALASILDLQNETQKTLISKLSTEKCRLVCTTILSTFPGLMAMYQDCHLTVSIFPSLLDSLEPIPMFRISTFEWMRFFKGVAGSLIQPTDKIIISNANAITNSLEILLYTPKRTVVNLILLRFVKSKTNVLPGSFKAATLELENVLTGQEAMIPLWKQCVSYVNTKMPLVVGKNYIEREFTVDSKNMVTRMANELKREFKSIIESKMWLDETTRSKAMSKISMLGLSVGYPEKIMNDTYVEDLYKKYKFNENQPFNNDILIGELKFKEMISKYKTKVDIDDWPTPVATVNAFNHILRNRIYIPAGIIQPPLFDLEYPNYVNYGLLGKILGHEVTHALDTTGMLFDETGRVGLWFSVTSLQSFTKNAECIIQQYSNYTDEYAKMKVNGKKTSPDNISDNGGLMDSYKAYKRTESFMGEEARLPGLNFSNDQLFFLSAAHLWCGVSRPEKAVLNIYKDTHSPGRFRVIGPMQNNKEFAQAFNCPQGSYMNPKEKCILW